MKTQAQAHTKKWSNWMPRREVKKCCTVNELKRAGNARNAHISSVSFFIYVVTLSRWRRYQLCVCSALIYILRLGLVWCCSMHIPIFKNSVCGIVAKLSSSIEYIHKSLEILFDIDIGYGHGTPFNKLNS